MSKINCVEAIIKMKEGAFVTCEGFDNNESIHFYNNEFYLEDGAVVDIEWLSEKHGFEVVATPDKVNKELLESLHNYYKGYTCSYGSCKLDYQACIQEKYAWLGSIRNINEEKEIMIKPVNNNGRGEFVNPFNMTEKTNTSSVHSVQSESVNKTAPKSTMTDKEKEICEMFRKSDAEKSKICWPKFIIVGALFLIACYGLSYMQNNKLGPFNDYSVDDTVDYIGDVATGKKELNSSEMTLQNHISTCKRYIDAISDSEGYYQSKSKKTIEAELGYIVIKETQIDNSTGISSSYKWTFIYTDDPTDGQCFSEKQ